MNKAKIFVIYNPNTNEYTFNVQIHTRIDGWYYYAGNGQFCSTMEQAIDFCNSYNIPDNMREWCVDSVDCRGKVWPVWCDEKLVCEIMENTIKTDRGINWYNFQDGDFYWDDNGFRYVVNIAGGLITVTEE